MSESVTMSIMDEDAVFGVSASCFIQIRALFGVRMEFGFSVEVSV